jgi:hypothetical protein
MSTAEIANRQFTIEHFLERSGREALPLAMAFTQGRTDQKRACAGPLATFVRRSREGALEQYLLFHALASNGEEGFDVRLPAASWARAIGGWYDPKSGVVAPSALHAVSRNWAFLRELKLVEVERVARRVRATLLADDGSGEPYRHLGAGMKDQRLGGPGYLQLPYAYWREGWHERLSVVAKAMLLIALYLGDGFPLPYAKLPEWYGIGAASGERGLRELRAHKLLHTERLRRPDAESPVGFSWANYYELRPPFGPRGVLSKGAHPDWSGAAADGGRTTTVVAVSP